ncbi:MAG: GNAT family N-acetyltransferase [Devosiaceae bacterium]|nr:GNAT family N-acetyltransferase [Devosiaceae bacterium MH13]
MSEGGIVLETTRLRLRGWELEDFEPVASFLADDEANRFRGGGVDRGEAWKWFEGLAGSWLLRGYGTFAVEELEEEELIGWAGLWHPHNLQEPELCWSIFPQHRGHGYAPEAASAALVWWTQMEGQPAPFSMTHPDNKASQRVAEKLGAERCEDMMFEGRHSWVYRHKVPDDAQWERRS